VHADLLLIDEAAGRAEAKRRHLRVTGHAILLTRCLAGRRRASGR
jgi:predicted nucleic acid-binding protein